MRISIYVRMNTALLLLISIIPSIRSECKDYSSQQDIQLKQTEGLWHGQYTFMDKITKDYKCLRLQHQVKEDGKSLNLIKSKLQLNGEGAKWLNFLASGQQTGSDGKLIMTGRTKDGPVKFQYWITDTDYNNFMVVNVCAKGSLNAWSILTRKSQLDQNTKQVISDSLTKNQLTMDKFGYRHNDTCTSN